MSGHKSVNERNKIKKIKKREGFMPSLFDQYKKNCFLKVTENFNLFPYH